MKKVLICGVIAAAFGFGAAQAGTADAGFDVKATFTSKCVADNGVTTPAVDFGLVDAFDARATVTATAASIAFKCTMGLAPTATIDGTSSTTASGTLRGLAYTIGVVDPNGTKAPGGTAATGDRFTYSVGGTLTTGGGDTTDAATKPHTLTVSF